MDTDTDPHRDIAASSPSGQVFLPSPEVKKKRQRREHNARNEVVKGSKWRAFVDNDGKRPELIVEVTPKDDRVPVKYAGGRHGSMLVETLLAHYERIAVPRLAEAAIAEPTAAPDPYVGLEPDVAEAAKELDEHRLRTLATKLGAIVLFPTEEDRKGIDALVQRERAAVAHLGSTVAATITPEVVLLGALRARQPPQAQQITLPFPKRPGAPG